MGKAGALPDLRRMPRKHASEGHHIVIITRAAKLFAQMQAENRFIIIELAGAARGIRTPDPLITKQRLDDITPDQGCS